jgi:hypothetical protein
MLVKFTTQGPLDFVNNWYVLAFDVDGKGEPYALYANQANNWTNVNWEIIVEQPAGTASPQVLLWAFVQQSGGSTLKQPYGPVQFNPQDIVPNYNCNSSLTQFCLTINRNIFSLGPSGTAAAGNSWFINWFVASPSGGASGVPAGTVISAPGQTGINDTSFVYNVDVTTTFDTTWTGYAPPAWPAAPSAAAQLMGGEVANNP